MRIGKLDQHCGNCKILQYCAEPFSELCVCARTALEDMQEEEYIRQAEEIRRKWKRNKRASISNTAICNRICREEEKRKNATPSGHSYKSMKSSGQQRTAEEVSQR